MPARDRHDRARRGEPDRRRRPVDGFRLRDDRRFELLVEDVLATLPAALLREIADADLRIEALPAEEPRETEPRLALLDATVRPRRLTVYRRPIEARAGSRLELAEVIRSAVGREVADTFGLSDWDDD